MEGDDVTMRRLLAAIIATGCCLLTNVPTGVATGPIETYQNWSDDLKSYTQTVCDEYDVDYSLALGVIYNESRFQSSLTHLNSNGTTDYGLMQVNEVNLEYLHKTVGINSMHELLDDRTGIRCGVQLLAYHKQYTKNDSTALLRYQIGAGKYKQYLKAGRYTNQTHQQVLTYQSEFKSYLDSLEPQKNILVEQRIQKLINRWSVPPLICWCSSEAEHGTCNTGVEISKFSTSSINSGRPHQRLCITKENNYDY